jgi:bifunctional DNA-binding transcriptional regulator/antitoxin component of YhaV-PrlF toxin-antitoxin module
MQVKPDVAHRIVLTRELRNALNLKPGQPLEVSISSGVLLLSPAPLRTGKVVRKGNIKVYTGKLPGVDVEEAVNKARQHRR